MSKNELYAETKKYFKDFDSDNNKVLDSKWLTDISVDDAIKNAEKVRKQNNYKDCSTTNVDELIKFLRSTLRAK